MTTNQTQQTLCDLSRVKVQFQLYTVLEAMGVKYERDSKWVEGGKNEKWGF